MAHHAVRPLHTLSVIQHEKHMAQYAIAFDLDTRAMTAAGLTRADITSVYQTEIPDALTACGFTAHPQGSLYHTKADADPITAIMRLQGSLRGQAPRFCRYVRRVHVFRMEEWSDVTPLISTAGAQAAPAPAPDEELEEADFLEHQRDIALGR
jgi:virulence-associated protein VapD